jgi:hypothetical protein
MVTPSGSLVLKSEGVPSGLLMDVGRGNLQLQLLSAFCKWRVRRWVMGSRCSGV